MSEQPAKPSLVQMQAARWLVKLDTAHEQGLDPERLQREFASWLREDPEHRAAYVGAREFYARVARLPKGSALKDREMTLKARSSIRFERRLRYRRRMNSLGIIGHWALVRRTWRDFRFLCALAYYGACSRLAIRRAMRQSSALEVRLEARASLRQLGELGEMETADAVRVLRAIHVRALALGISGPNDRTTPEKPN